MKNKRSNITTVFAVCIMLLMTGALFAQDTQTLLAQLTGDSQAPQRSAAQLETVYQTAIKAMVPLMSAEDVESRYAHQITLQYMAAHASRPGAETEREVLAKVLGSTVLSTNMPATLRHWFVLQLERMGKGESVSVLTKLMSDPDTAMQDYARRALQKNPASSATEALIKALEGAKDTKQTVGLLHALGDRGDQAAVRVVARKLKSESADVADAAVIALANLGGQAAGRVLTDALSNPGTADAMKIAQGLVTVAQDMQAQNDYAGASTIFSDLHKVASKSDGKNSHAIRLAVMNGLVVCDPPKGARLVAQAIKDKDPKVRAGAVLAARLAPDKTTLRLLSQQLIDLDEVSQVQVLGLIADRGDLSSIPFVSPLLGQASSPVQVAAVKALTKTGNAASATAVLGATVSSDRAVQKAARQGIALMVGPNVEDVIVAQAEAGEITLRSEAISAMGSRTMTASVPQLLAFAAEHNTQVARAACKALGSVASEGDIKALATLVVAATDNGVRNDAVTTLKAVLTTAELQEDGAKVVIDQMSSASEQGKLALVKSLNALGGSTHALKYVITATGSDNRALQDAAIRTLSDWPDYVAAKVLVDIAADKDMSMIHHVVAMRGALRLIQATDTVPADTRVTLCLKALDQTRRVEEKRQAITALGTLPVKAAADQLLALIKDQSVSNEAALAAVELASRLRSQDRTASRALAQKIRDMDISSAVNRNADRVIRGRR